MKKYIVIYLTHIKNSIIREMLFKGNLLIMSFTTVFLNIYFLAFYLVLAKLTDNNFLGWNKDQLIFFLGTEIICHSLFMSFCFFNVFSLNDKVSTGDLDFILIKPVSSRFLLSTGQIDISMLVQTIFGIGLCIYSAAKLNLNINPFILVLYILAVLNGVFLMYLIAFTLMSFSFFIGRAFSSGAAFPYRGFFSLYWFARRPEIIYSSITIQALTYVVPLLLIVNLPVKIMFDNYNIGTILFTLALTPVFYLITDIIWKKGLRRYESASS